jgi:tetratricopeptide (TPR) repeat protein
LSQVEGEFLSHPVDNTEIVKLLEKALQISPDLPIALYNKAVALRRMGCTDEAMLELRKIPKHDKFETKAEEIDSRYLEASVHSELAGNYIQMDERGKAPQVIQEYKSAIELLEYLRGIGAKDVIIELSELYSLLGAFYAEVLRDYAAAEKYTVKGVEYNPDNKVAHYNLGDMYLCVFHAKLNTHFTGS